MKNRFFHFNPVQCNCRMGLTIDSSIMYYVSSNWICSSQRTHFQRKYSPVHSQFYAMSIKKLCLYLFFYFPVVTVTIFLISWIYLSSETIDNLIKIDEAAELEFDYVIIGGGTAGCVLAERLSQNEEARVLLIEAGGTFGPLSMIPLLASQQQKTQVDWHLQTTPQQYSSFGFVDRVRNTRVFALRKSLNSILWDSRFNFFPEVRVWAVLVS